MCGIFFSLCVLGPLLPDEKTAALLRNRGPDSFQTYTAQIANLQHPVDASEAGGINAAYLTFVSTVLALRGNHVQSQPLVDPISKSVFCWNGEAWKIAGEPVRGNDTELIFRLLLEVASGTAMKKQAGINTDQDDHLSELTNLISTISGPFSFVFYDGINSRLFFGRDCLGKRSLLQGFDENGSLKICSISDATSPMSFEEVDTNGFHMIDLLQLTERNDSDKCTISSKMNYIKVRTIPWTYDVQTRGYFLVRFNIKYG
jgi:asparagine synthetase B (glutamine-hydrolysing)